MIKTVSLTADTETKVEISGGYNVGVINRTTGMLYASRKSGISAGADDVAAIPAGDSYVIRAADDTVYLLATAAGDVQLESIGVTEVFRIAAARSSSGGGEGGTVDEVARQAISSHANNEEIHVTAAEKTAWNNKAELSDIPTSLPANGGISEHTSTAIIGTNSDVCKYSSILDWANDNDYNSWAFVLEAYGHPTDSPIQFEAFISLETEQLNKARKMVTWKSYGDLHETRCRMIFRNAWLGEWFNPADGGNADTVDGKHASDFVLKSEYDALAARVAALENGT